MLLFGLLLGGFIGVFVVCALVMAKQEQKKLKDIKKDAQNSRASFLFRKQNILFGTLLV